MINNSLPSATICILLMESNLITVNTIAYQVATIFLKSYITVLDHMIGAVKRFTLVSGSSLKKTHHAFSCSILPLFHCQRKLLF